MWGFLFGFCSRHLWSNWLLCAVEDKYAHGLATHHDEEDWPVPSDEVVKTCYGVNEAIEVEAERQPNRKYHHKLVSYS